MFQPLSQLSPQKRFIHKMGGCAGKPKHSDVHKEPIPTEDPAHANKAEGEAIPQVLVCITFWPYLSR